MTEERKHIEVTVRVFVQNKNGEILLVRAVKEGNMFTVPGGHIEFGEQAADTAIRELKEEVGLDIKDLEFLTFTETIRENEHYVILRFKACLADENQEPKLLAEELSEYAWMNHSDALEHPDVKPNAKKIIEKYL